jgi:dCTP deaminase
MILADQHIHQRLDRGQLLADGWDETKEHLVQPASLDIRLGHEIHRLGEHGTRMIEDESHVRSGEFLLAHTMETVDVPPDLVGLVTGRSTVGREGLMIHITAGLCDPGYRGQITLELCNVSGSAVRIEPGQRIGQIMWVRTSMPSQDPYGTTDDDHYQGQMGATPADPDAW